MTLKRNKSKQTNKSHNQILSIIKKKEEKVWTAFWTAWR